MWTTGNKIMWTFKEEKLLLRSNFSSFPHYYIYIFLASGVKLHIDLLNVVVQFIVFLTLSTLICRGTDISKCFSVSPLEFEITRVDCICNHIFAIVSVTVEHFFEVLRFSQPIRVISSAVS